MFDFFGSGDEEDERGGAIPEKHDGLPNSDVKNGLCPRCMKQSSFDVMETVPITFDGGYLAKSDGSKEPTHTDQVSILLCRHCRQGIVVVEEKYEESNSSRMGGRLIRWRGVHWWPLPTPDLSGGVPEEIGKAFSEAERCLAANCPRAAAVMGRRTLEVITNHLGKSSGSLYNQLEELRDEDDIHPTLYEWATEIRLIGNVGAHFDPMESVSHEEAEQLISFLKELMRFVFEFPTKLDELRNS